MCQSLSIFWKMILVSWIPWKIAAIFKLLVFPHILEEMENSGDFIENYGSKLVPAVRPLKIEHFRKKKSS